MPKSKPSNTKAPSPHLIEDKTGKGGELQQMAASASQALTTTDGTPVADNQNTVKAHARGPSLLSDVVFQDKLSHFDKERIPERVVHARGTGAHGYFELIHSLADHTTAQVLTEVGVRTPVFARLSTVGGSAGSADTVRDVRGFSVKFYTPQGNWDLVGNNIPVFFIQDAMKFPDLVHSVKPEPDRGFPTASSAHDTFWDFISHMPESAHMTLWLMSDRAIPRSLRMMEGFGVHTFKLINAKGQATFVKYHWRPVLGVQSLVWDEAVKLAGADPDYHRKDLWEAIDMGSYPEWELAVQLFTEEEAKQFPFDHLDATKLIPEELVPLKVIGKMVLNQNPVNVFTDTEQVAYCPSRIVPGMDFSNDPLLHGRLFSYRDTHAHRLGGANFNQLEINRPKCPVNHYALGGFSQQRAPAVPQVAYEPNGLGSQGPRAYPGGLSISHDAAPANQGAAHGVTRDRSTTFADHFSQARLFLHSQSAIEQDHIVSAYVFELAKVHSAAVRNKVLALLQQVDDTLASRVAQGLGVALPAPKDKARISQAEGLQDVSAALATIGKMKHTLQGRCIGILLADGTPRKAVDKLAKAAQAAGAQVKLVAPRKHGVVLSAGKDNQSGTEVAVDFTIDTGPSVLFDAVAVLLTPARADQLASHPAVRNFVSDAFHHLKAIAIDEGGQHLLNVMGLAPDEFVIDSEQAQAFVDCATHRLWKREASRQAQV